MSAASHIDPTTDPRDTNQLPAPVMVADAASLRELCAELEAVDQFGVDTEADSFYSYREKVCLIQISVGGIDYLVDPFADMDLAPLGEIFANPAITKIFHDGEFDLTILNREFDMVFANLFDTRVAAAALGMSSPGLAAVLNHYFGVEVDKSEQRSDWSRRPLTRSQINYARLDTRYLHALKERMHAELVERDRLMVLTGECERLEELRATERQFNPEDFLRIKGARRLNKVEQSVLRELFILRDGLAEKRDVPTFKILGNGVLLSLAQRQPTKLEGLEGLKGFPRGRMGSMGRSVLQAIAKGMEAGPYRAPKQEHDARTPRLEDEEFELHERFRDWRRGASDKEGMDSSLVLNRHAMLRLALARPADAAALAKVEGVMPWQAERYGAAWLELVAQFERELAAGEIDFDRRRKRR